MSDFVGMDSAVTWHFDAVVELRSLCNMFPVIRVSVFRADAPPWPAAT